MEKYKFLLSCIFTLSFYHIAFSQFSKKYGYDSTYDFNTIWNNNHNPKDLIGQELEFAPRNKNYRLGSPVSKFNNLRDSFFICFSTSKTIKVSTIINKFPENFFGFDLVDGSRHPKNYSRSFLADTATTNTYKPALIVTQAYPFKLNGDSSKKAVVIGTNYSELENKIFKIKDATCFFDYYDSQIWYFFKLSDSEGNEVNFFSYCCESLEAIIHIKGFIEKEKKTIPKTVFRFRKYDRVNIGIDTLPYMFEISYADTSTNKSIDLYNSHWTGISFKYISKTDGFFQVLYAELKNEKNQKIYINLMRPPEYDEWKEFK